MNTLRWTENQITELDKLLIPKPSTNIILDYFWNFGKEKNDIILTITLNYFSEMHKYNETYIRTISFHKDHIYKYFGQPNLSGDCDILTFDENKFYVGKLNGKDIFCDKRISNTNWNCIKYLYEHCLLHLEHLIMTEKISFNDVNSDMMTHNIYVIIVKKILNIPFD